MYIINLWNIFLGSPFRVHVRDRLDANRVNVKMSPVMRANVLQEILIDGQTAGPGSPSVDITDIHGILLFYRKMYVKKFCIS